MRERNGPYLQSCGATGARVSLLTADSLQRLPRIFNEQAAGPGIMSERDSQKWLRTGFMPATCKCLSGPCTKTCTTGYCRDHFPLLETIAAKTTLVRRSLVTDNLNKWCNLIHASQTEVARFRATVLTFDFITLNWDLIRVHILGVAPDSPGAVTLRAFLDTMLDHANHDSACAAYDCELRTRYAYLFDPTERLPRVEPLVW